MKKKLILFMIGLGWMLPVMMTAQPQKGNDYPVQTNAHVAVILIDFPDTKKEIRDLYPTSAEITKELFDSNRFIQRYLKTMSYGKFNFTGEVFGPFTHQDGINALNGYQMDAYKTINTITIPGFQFSNYTHFAFIAYNDWNPGGGCSFGRNSGLTVKINGQSVNLPSFFRMVLAVGPYQRNPANGFSNHYTDLLMSQIFVPLSVKPDGEYFYSNYTGMTTFQRVFLHELFHTQGIWVHANSSTNGDHFYWEPEVSGNKDFLNHEYGNKMDMMGDAHWGFSLNSCFRDLLGWTDNQNRIKLTEYGIQRVRIYPVNRSSGFRLVEIRIPYAWSVRNSLDSEFPASGRKNKGYFLEVREPDKWDSTLIHPSIQPITSGVVILQTDGYSSALLDASPSPNLSYSWGSVPDLRDIALKPGMRYRDNQISLSRVVKNSDGSFSLDIEIIDPSKVPGKTILASSGYVSAGSVAFRWNQIPGAEKYFLELCKDQSFVNIVRRDSTRLDTALTITGLEVNTKYYWRVRAKNSAGYGGWSDAGNFTVTAVGIIVQNDRLEGEDLLLNYPNPFGSTTTIRFHVTVKEFVSIKIVDMVGREIAVLVSEVRSPGRYEVKFEAGNLPPGLLLCEFTSGPSACIRKMLLLK